MVWLLLALSMVAAVLPMGLAIAVVWWLDRYDREPIWLMTLTFFWGALGAMALSLLISGLALFGLSTVVPSTSMELAGALIAPLIEEPCKALFLVALLYSRHFDNATDGFVYGATIGLGFAVTENLLYFAVSGLEGSPSFWVQTVVVRTLYTGLMHAAATATVGACLGLAHFRGLRVLALGGGVGLALGIGVHALWNGLLAMDLLLGLDDIGFIINLVLFPLEALFLMALFQVCLWNEQRGIRRELAAEAREEHTLPIEHAEHMGSYIRRTWRTDWLPTGIPTTEYIRVATTLAMRRHQARLLGDRPPADFYNAQITALRTELTALQRR